MTTMFRGPFDRPRRAARPAISTASLSRRDVLPFVAGAAAVSAVLAVKPARAQAVAWREYRRDDLGFRVEMPGEPKIEVEEDQYKDIWIRAIDAEVQVEQTTLNVHCIEWKQVVRAEEDFAHFREGMLRVGMQVTREAALDMNGFPAREFARETDPVHYIRREVVMERYTISAMAFGERGIHTDAMVRRFLESFKLLRNAR